MTYLLSYFMCYIALVRCVLVLRCGLAGGGVVSGCKLQPASAYNEVKSYLMWMVAKCNK